jgi:hypothetical protein
MTPVVHVGRAYSHPNQRGMPTTSAAMAKTGAPLRHKMKASTRTAMRTMKPIDAQAWIMAQTSPQMGTETVEPSKRLLISNFPFVMRAGWLMLA